MTRLGVFLAKRSINQADLGRRIGSTRQRINKLTNEEKTVLTAREMHLIALALNIQVNELSDFLHNDLKLND